jgi:hypothetical protein
MWLLADLLVGGQLDSAVPESIVRPGVSLTGSFLLGRRVWNCLASHTESDNCEETPVDPSKEISSTGGRFLYLLIVLQLSEMCFTLSTVSVVPLFELAAFELEVEPVI